MLAQSENEASTAMHTPSPRRAVAQEVLRRTRWVAMVDLPLLYAQGIAPIH